MKRLFVILTFVLASCLLLSACGEVQTSAATPTAATTETHAPTAAVTAEPTGEDSDELDYDDLDKIHADLKEYYSGYIEEADKCRVKVGDTEYYLDTSKVLEMDVCPEFPLYMLKDGDLPEYLGTTGFAFQVFGGYIYVQSDPLQEDWPDGVYTRVVDLNDFSVTAIGRNIHITVPKQGSKVYYTKDADCSIFITDASLKEPEKMLIEIPDKRTVDKKVKESYEYDISDLVELVRITNIEDDWVYFNYWMFEPEGGLYYDGNYRIKTDGSEIKKTDEGKFE